MKYSIILMAIGFSLLTSCGGEKKNEKSMEEKNFSKEDFGYDLNFLKNKDENLIVLKQDSSRVIVSPKYQAKVFTSTAAGGEGMSFGWINYEAFGGEEDPHMNAYGGGKSILAWARRQQIFTFLQAR
ncbi:MAG TPA: DUF6786 family protein, partial [Salinimicrobium sp.]|nr:DUF6786 family protein [Salinimicrobium sp.]